MKYKFGDCVITKDNTIGIVDRVCFDGYIIKFNSGKYGFYFEDEITEWHGCW